MKQNANPRGYRFNNNLVEKEKVITKKNHRSLTAQIEYLMEKDIEENKHLFINTGNDAVNIMGSGNIQKVKKAKK